MPYAALVLVLAFQHGDAGRISVKRCTDPEAGQIDTKPRRTTVEGLLQMARPSDMGKGIDAPKYQNHRIANFETSTWSVKAKIVNIVLREDGDFYMVVESPGGARTVCEVPDPSLCKGSRFLKQLTQVRETLRKRFNPTRQPRTVDATADLTGIGFFGRQGKGNNGARLMPLTGVKL